MPEVSNLCFSHRYVMMMMDRVQEGEGILGWTEIIWRSLTCCRSGGGFVLHRESNLSLLGGAPLSHIWHSRTETTQLEAFQSLTFWPESSWETDCAASSDISDPSSAPGSGSEWKSLPLPFVRWEVIHTVWVERNPSYWHTNLKSNKVLASEETRTHSESAGNSHRKGQRAFWIENSWKNGCECICYHLKGGLMGTNAAAEQTSWHWEHPHHCLWDRRGLQPPSWNQEVIVYGSFSIQWQLGSNSSQFSQLI